MNFREFFGGNKPQEGKVVDSHDQVDPKAELENLKNRVSVLRGQQEISPDEQEELRTIGAKIDNLESTIGGQ